ncbi:MAG: hypothetical protein ACREQ5_05115 [Candidatus Dormibacteria bacterium]
MDGANAPEHAASRTSAWCAPRGKGRREVQLITPSILEQNSELSGRVITAKASSTRGSDANAVDLTTALDAYDRAIPDRCDVRQVVRHQQCARARASPPRRATALLLTCGKADSSARWTATHRPENSRLR